MVSGQTCYFPDGSKATSDTACHDPSPGDNGASACCNSLDACLESHLCLEQSGGPMISRGSCTDQTWQSQECSQYCADGKKIFIVDSKVEIWTQENKSFDGFTLTADICSWPYQWAMDIPSVCPK